MKNKVVFGLADNENIASNVVNRLLANGFSKGDISVLSPDRRNITTEMSSKAPEGATTGATIGGIIGGTLGLLAGIGTLAIPGLGAFVAAGPIMAALGGSGAGGGLGLLLGSLIGWGIPEYEAKKYESALKSGGTILISVHAETREEITRAEDLMKKEGARDISSTTEKSTA